MYFTKYSVQYTSKEPAKTNYWMCVIITAHTPSPLLAITKKH